MSSLNSVSDFDRIISLLLIYTYSQYIRMKDTFLYLALKVIATNYILRHFEFPYEGEMC